MSFIHRVVLTCGSWARLHPRWLAWSVLFVAACGVAAGCNNSSPPAVSDALAPDTVTYPDHTVWAVSAGGSGFDHANGIAIGADGSSYIVGEFVGAARFGPHQVVSQGGFDLFVARLDPSGAFVWATPGGSTGSEYGAAVALADGDDPVLTGRFEKTLHLGTLSATSSDRESVLVARLGTSGKPVWVLSAGGPKWDAGGAIAVDPGGNVLVVGQFEDNARFDTMELASNGGRDVFVAKLTPSGKPLWCVSAGGPQSDYGSSIAALPDGGAVITGTFSGKATFGPWTLVSRGMSDVYVARLSGDGAFVWAAGGGGVDYDGGRGIDADPSGNTYVTGRFRGQASFGSHVLHSRGDSDILVAKLDLPGNVVWARSAGGPGHDGGVAVAARSDAVLVTGGFEQDAHFSQTVISSRGEDDIFVAEYSNTGQQEWVVQGGGPAGDVGTGIALFPDGTVGVVGLFQQHTYLGRTRLTAKGLTDVFVWRLRAP